MWNRNNGTWFRSQNKKDLMQCQRICIDHKIISGLVGELVFLLGQYDTEERAIEVLDEIHRRIDLNVAGVYQMPDK